MNLTVITDLSEFENLEAQWNTLLAKSESNHIHSTFEWLFTWYKYFGEDKSLCILLATDDNEIRGIAPLMIRKVSKFYTNTLWFKQLTFIGAGFMDSADFIIENDHSQIISLFREYILTHDYEWDEIYLPQINCESASLNELKFFEDFNYNIHNDHLIGCPFLILEGNFENYYKSISSVWRKKNERNIRKLKNSGELKFYAEKEISKENLNRIIELNEKRKLDSGRMSPLLDANKLEFIKDITNQFYKKDWLRFFYLTHNDKILTYSLTFKYDNKIYRWNTSFDIDFSVFSVGRILTKYILEYCFNNNYTACDWMAGVEDHKFKWADQIRKNNSFAVSKKNLKTGIASSYRLFKKYLRKNELIK